MKINKKETLIKNFIETKEFNILIANIYNTYLEECRQSINEELLNTYRDDENPIYSAFLDVLDIDQDDNEFKNLSKRYHINDIKKLDIKKYQENAYFKNIKINTEHFDKRTIKYSEYKPYECFLYDELYIEPSSFYKEITKIGYFDKPFKYIEVLENDVTWMSITPHEINTMDDDIKAVTGDILVLGLGLGYFPYMAALKSEVKSITIIEKDKRVIELFTKYILPQFNTNKIKIIEDDALSYLNNSKEKYDFVYCDLYHNAIDGLPLYIKVKSFEESMKNTKFLYWIETSILALLRRYLILIFEENLDGATDKDYIKAKNVEDKIINQIYVQIKNKVFISRKEIEDLLSDKSLKELVKKISL